MERLIVQLDPEDSLSLAATPSPRYLTWQQLCCTDSPKSPASTQCCFSVGDKPVKWSKNNIWPEGRVLCLRPFHCSWSYMSHALPLKPQAPSSGQASLSTSPPFQSLAPQACVSADWSPICSATLPCISPPLLPSTPSPFFQYRNRNDGFPHTGPVLQTQVSFSFLDIKHPQTIL